MAHKKWIIRQANKEKASSISEKFNIDPFLAFLLVSRGIDDEMNLANFLSDSFKLSSPLDFADMDEAIFTIGDAIDNGEKICVYGDYDCDGVTSTALLFDYFQSEGADICYYIPDRQEGYGLNINSVEKLAQDGVKLIVTVDNGISAIKEADRIYELGMRLVITDHHQLGETMPKAEAIVNPHRPDNQLQFKDYCGVGVAFKLVSAMYEGDVEDIIDRYIELVTLGTIADIVPLVGENRAFVKAGMNKINNDPSLFIQAFKSTNGIDGKTKKYSSQDVAFQICPKINVAGRLDSATKAFDFLTAPDYEKATFKYEQLSIDNNSRQEIEQEILTDILNNVAKNPKLTNNRVLVFSGNNYNSGVIGIVASRVLEMYGKPTIIISIDENGDCHGSCRSIDGFNMFEAVSYCKDDLVKFGGHPMAAGLSLKEKDIDSFIKHINQFAVDNYPIMPQLTLELDCKLSPHYLSLDLVDNLSNLEPFGANNPSPIFGIYKLILQNVTPLSDGKHVKMELEKKGKKIKVVMFGTRYDQFAYNIGQLVDLAVSISKNEYNGRTYLSIQCKDIKLSSNDDDKYFEEKQQYEEFLITKKGNKNMYPNRDICVIIYKYLKKHKDITYKFDDLYFIVQSKINYAQLKFALVAFKQCELIDDTDLISFNQTENKVDLENTKILKYLKGRLNFE